MALAACSGPAPAPPAAAAAKPDPWPEFAARFLEDYFKANPFFAVQAGRHEFDGQMPDLSAAGIATEVARLQKLRAEAQGLDAEAMTPAGAFRARTSLHASSTADLFWLDRARLPFTNPAWYIEQLDPDVYLNRAYAPLAKRLEGYIGYARAIPGIAADIRANLKTPLPQSFVARGIGAFGGFAVFYRKQVAPLFAAVKDPAAQRALAEADAAAAKAMEELKSWLEGERRHATQGFALGEPLFLEMLKVTERVDVPLSQLLQLGQRGP